MSFAFNTIFLLLPILFLLSKMTDSHDQHHHHHGHHSHGLQTPIDSASFTEVNREHWKYVYPVFILTRNLATTVMMSFDTNKLVNMLRRTPPNSGKKTSSTKSMLSF